MIDTSKEARAKFYKLMMAKSPEERLRMGCSMFGSAKQIVKSAIINQNPGIKSDDLNKQIFLRFYGLEFKDTEKEKVLKAIK